MLRAHSQHSEEPAEREAPGIYSRRQICRLLHIDARQLKTWERQKLVPELSEYRFTDLLALKTVAQLRAEQMPARKIRQALEALKTYLNGSSASTADVRVYKDGRTVRIQIGKHRMEPASGQLLFDFSEQEINKLLQLPQTRRGDAVTHTVRQKIEADRWFERGLHLEQIGAPFEQIIEAYTKAAELDPNSAGALVNLGTVFFNGHAWADAEAQYLKAIAIDRNYPLAHFNLGNLYDEQGDADSAAEHYLIALRLNPSYADAHYNLALLYQAQSDMLKAVRHWKAYLKLDRGSEWGDIARRELEKLEAVTILPGSSKVKMSTRSTD